MFEAESSQAGVADEKTDCEDGEKANSKENGQVEGSAATQEATDAEKEKESAIAGLPMGLGMAASDFRRLHANARELLCLSSPVRRTLFGSAASTAAPPTPLNHSTPQGPPPLERSQSGLSTDGEFF